LALLIFGSVVLLLLGALPVLADGGPHTATVNNGKDPLVGIAADSCAGCHRAHTAQGAFLIVEEEPALCLACHGTASTGATTDVMNGIQYRLGSSDIRGTQILGALRGGGFAQARLDTGNVGRLSYSSSHGVSQDAVVPVLSAGQNVTSRHLNPGTLPAASTVWGNGAISASANPGTSLTLECTSCHNPHGNGMYRILEPYPGDGTGPFVESATAANVTDAPPVPDGDVRNYTVIQKKGTEGTPATYLLYASDVVALTNYSATMGDYWHKRLPWYGTASGTYDKDAPNGQPSTFDTQINAWCSSCHTRYLAITGTPYKTDSGDAIFTYRHSNTSDKPCTTCHVAHGSNAQMTGPYSSTETYPGGTTPAADSRLLKIDNRGTCQACHDPTNTTVAGDYVGPVPTPLVP
jgi:predicted CXXCH cytochrome family protein